MLSLVDLAALTLLAFAVLAAFDGVYVHLLALRLHARPASWVEHLWHTASAILFVPIVALLFVEPAHGPALWFGVGAAIAMYVVEVFDMQAEREARADLGGLSRGEFAIHIGAVVTRTAALGLVLASRPAEAWGLGPVPHSVSSPLAQTIGLGVLGGALVITTIHIVLAAVHCPQCATDRTANSGAAG